MGICKESTYSNIIRSHHFCYSAYFSIFLFTSIIFINNNYCFDSHIKRSTQFIFSWYDTK